MMLLTIAIPTYNGEENIKINLKKLIKLKEKFSFEIVVSDNHSTDNTATIVKSFKGIKYFKNKKNLGYDHNCHMCIKRSRGRYVWLLSDNDSFNIKYFKNIYYFLKKHKDLTLIYLNYHSAPKIHNIKRQREIFKIYKNGDDFFDAVNFKNGFMSSNIVNSKKWLSIFMKKYIGTGWIHNEYAWRSMESKNVKSVICRLDVVYSLPIENQKWGDKGTFIYGGIDLVNIVKKASKKYYSQKTINNGIWKIEGGYPLNLIRAKIAGLCTDKKFRNKFYQAFGFNRRSFFIYHPIFLLPNSIFLALYAIFRGIVVILKPFLRKPLSYLRNS